MDKVIVTASEAQRDLKQSYYSGNAFDIGDYEPTIAGMLSVAHKAIFATLFRPTILDVKNIVMFVSSLENTGSLKRELSSVRVWSVESVSKMSGGSGEAPWSAVSVASEPASLK
jgi:hypothetical protein